MNNIIMVALDSTYVKASGIWQWDYGQILRMQGKKFPKAVEVHFSLNDKGGNAVTRIGTTTDGATDVPIPDSFLENSGCTKDYIVYAFLYLADESKGSTEYKIAMPIKARPKPEIPGTPDEPELFREVIKNVNEAAERAETAEENARNSAQTATEKEESTEKNAKEVTEAKEHIDEAIKTFDKDSSEKLEKINAAKKDTEYYAGMAEQIATKNGFCQMEINESGHIILKRTDTIADNINFALNEKGHLEVEIK